MTRNTPVASYKVLVSILLIFATLSQASRFPKFHSRKNHLNFHKLSGYNYTTLYYNQQVDHFGYINTDTYRQRVLLNDKFWDKNNGPIFFYTGNEGDITWFCNNTGFMWELAPKFKAMLVFAEHRYYGKSIPYGEAELKDPTKLQYLTTEQALADFAVLIHHLKTSIPGAAQSKVIAFGGSYGGMLAAWFRMKYPNIIDGALAASAPIWNFYGQLPCQAASEVVTRTFNNTSPMCVKNIRQTWKTINEMADTASGQDYLTQEMKLCTPIKDAVALKDWLEDVYTNLAMVDYPYPASFLEPLPAWPVEAVCQSLSKPDLMGKSLIQALSTAMQIYYNYTGQAKCLNLSQDATGDLGAQLWNYQVCTEMVMLFCNTGTDDMFEPSVANFTEFSDACYKSYKVRPRKDWPIIQFLGKKIESITNIIFSNGMLDPWSAGGVLKTLTSKLPAIHIPNGAHHVDLRASHVLDTPDINEARTLENKYISEWLGTTKKDNKLYYQKHQTFMDHLYTIMDQFS